MDRTAFMDGERISFYPVEEDDLERLRDIINHPDVWRWVSVVEPKSLDDEQAFLEHVRESDQSTFLAVHGDEAVGTVELRPGADQDRNAELGIMLDPDLHGDGLGTEAVGLMVRYGFETLGLHRIWARTDERNAAMQRVFKKCGFTHEGAQREHRYADGTYHDMEIYGLVRDEWDGQ